MYKKDLVLNNIHGLACDKTQPTETYNQKVSSNYFYLMIVICIHTVQVT